MRNPQIHGSMNEDMELIGAKDIGQQALLAGVSLLEDVGPVEEHKAEEVDPIDGPVVTVDLLTRMENLDEENLDEEKISALLSEMGEKECPDELVERAAAVAKALIEAKFEILKVRKSKKASKQRRQVASAGFKSVDKPKTSDGSVKAGGRGKIIKVAPGKLKGEHRKQARKRKTGSFKARLKIRVRRAKRYESAFANELYSVLDEAVTNDVTLRDEIMERTANIMDLMAEEFDEDVISVLEQAWSPMADAHNEGRLDEATATDEEFVATLKPCLVVFAKVLDRLENVEEAQDPMKALRDLA